MNLWRNYSGALNLNFIILFVLRADLILLHWFFPQVGVLIYSYTIGCDDWSILTANYEQLPFFRSCYAKMRSQLMGAIILFDY
jgi:hypothetical protein